MSDPLTFVASIAPLQTAIVIASDGGCRLKLDIPDSEMPAIVRLVLYRQQRLRVTFEVIDDDAQTEDRDRYFTR